MADIEFMDPPGKTPRGPAPHREIAEALKARPGLWARVLEDVAQSTPGLIRNGLLVAHRPAGSFEATARKNGDRWDIYARYIGENGEHR
jgi:hypothetical protein